MTKSAIAEINWLQNRFANLSLHDCLSLDLDNLDTARPEVLLALHQSITNAICYVVPNSFTNASTSNHVY